MTVGHPAPRVDAWCTRLVCRIAFVCVRTLAYHGFFARGAGGASGCRVSESERNAPKRKHTSVGSVEATLFSITILGRTPPLGAGKQRARNETNEKM